MYKIKRTRKFYDTLQLCDEEGSVQKELKIEVDIDAIATGFREVLTMLEKAQNELHDKQKLKQQKAFDKAYYDYGAALVKMFEPNLGCDTENGKNKSIQKHHSDERREN